MGEDFLKQRRVKNKGKMINQLYLSLELLFLKGHHEESEKTNHKLGEDNCSVYNQ